MSKLERLSATLGGFSLEPKGTPPASLSYTCPVCGPIEPLWIVTGRYIRRSCACERKTRQAAAGERERQEQMAHLAKRTYSWLGDAWADMDLAAKRFKEYQPERQPNEKDRALLRMALKKAQAFAQNPRGVLLLHGPYGVGKTHLLASVCNSLRERQVGSLFTTSPKFFSAFYDRMHHEQSEWDLVKQAMLTPLLVIDDLDKASPKEFRKEVFFQIIDERIKGSRPLAISTNELQDFAVYIGESSFSRLMMGCIPVVMTGKDYRLSYVIKDEGGKAP